jgi:hypothetical protein
MDLKSGLLFCRRPLLFAAPVAAVFSRVLQGWWRAKENGAAVNATDNLLWHKWYYNSLWLPCDVLEWHRTALRCADQ